MILRRLREGVRSLASQPRPRGTRKIKGTDKAYRIRVGRYRVASDIYENDKLVVILKVSLRTESTYH